MVLINMQKCSLANSKTQNAFGIVKCEGIWLKKLQFMSPISLVVFHQMSKLYTGFKYIKLKIQFLINRYCPIPPIEYPQLKEELFCHFYYLRHLTDNQRFPRWPIREPVEFLRACLSAWHDEITRKPAKMSVEQVWLKKLYKNCFK